MKRSFTQSVTFTREDVEVLIRDAYSIPEGAYIYLPHLNSFQVPVLGSASWPVAVPVGEVQ